MLEQTNDIDNLLITLNILPIGTSNEIQKKFYKFLQFGRIFIYIFIIILNIILIDFKMKSMDHDILYLKILINMTFVNLFLNGCFMIYYLKNFSKFLLKIVDELNTNRITVSKRKFYKFWAIFLIQIWLFFMDFLFQYLYDYPQFHFVSIYGCVIIQIQTVLQLIFLEILNHLEISFENLNNYIFQKHNRYNIEILLKKYDLLCDLVKFVIESNRLFLIMLHFNRFLVFLYFLCFTIDVKLLGRTFDYETASSLVEDVVGYCVVVWELFKECELILGCTRLIKKVRTGISIIMYIEKF